VRAVLLDTDRRGQAPQRDMRMVELAQRTRLRLIWQEPCHEAFLLRHLEGCQTPGRQVQPWQWRNCAAAGPTM
jgi:hypothetical protein